MEDTKVISNNVQTQSGLNMIDDVTLAYMVNTSQYEKYLKKNHIDYDFKLKRDIRFYRKRIISLTKDLFKHHTENDKSQILDTTIMSAFNMYMRACISYLKFSDQSETIQKCYVCLGINQINTYEDQDYTNTNINIKNQKCICKNKDDSFELNKANEMCFKQKEVKKITLDNYVIRKNVKKDEPITYPQQFTFNPRDPEFKYKGLKSKPQSRSQSKSQSKSQSTEKIKMESTSINPNNLNHKIKEITKQSNEIFNSVIMGETGESRENNIKKNTKRINKNKKEKKVSFDITNYIDNI